jgi:hypothetical protein
MPRSNGGDVICFAELYHHVKVPQALSLLRQWRVGPVATRNREFRRALARSVSPSTGSSASASLRSILRKRQAMDGGRDAARVSAIAARTIQVASRSPPLSGCIFRSRSSSSSVSPAGPQPGSQWGHICRIHFDGSLQAMPCSGHGARNRHMPSPLPKYSPVAGLTITLDRFYRWIQPKGNTFVWKSRRSNRIPVGLFPYSQIRQVPTGRKRCIDE